jgi:hypothetical protein
MEEKGSDVNLGAHLLLDAFRADMDLALVVSNDSDLRTPIQIVRKVLGRQVGVAIPGTVKSIKRSILPADFTERVSVAILQASQFPQNITDQHGVITKPATW